MSDAQWEAFGRYVAGESAPPEATAVESWLADHPDDANLAALVKHHSARIDERASVSVDTDRALALVRQRIAAEHGSTLRVQRGGASRALSPTPRRPWRTVGFAAAAGLVAVLGLSQFGRSGASGVPHEYRTAVGQRDSVMLPDGSSVVLAPGSVLTVAADYGEGARDVTLDGAAYFKVTHDAANPFTVHTRTADIRDIGTAFSVKTVADGGVSVAVTEGIVTLGARASAASPVALRAGDRGFVAADTVAITRGVVTDDDVAWTQGTLTYRDASVAEVRADLLRWYGVELQVADSALARRTITASFRGESSARVIEVLALMLGASVMQQGDTVQLLPAGAGATPVR